RYEDLLLYARILFSRGDKEKALAQLDDILKDARKHKIKLILVEAILLKLAILDMDGTGSKRERLNLIREAVHYSYANEMVSPFVLEGEAIRRALIELVKEQEDDLLARERQFVHRVLSLWDRNKPESLLSEREL